MDKGVFDKLIDTYCTNVVLDAYYHEYNTACDMCVLFPYKKELTKNGVTCDIETVKKALVESEGIV